MEDTTMPYRKSIVQNIQREAKLCHCPSIVEAKKGDLLCVWYEGAYETSPDTVLKGSFRRKNTSKWHSQRVVLKVPSVPLGNPVLFREGSNIYLIFSLLIRESWEWSLLCMSKSMDEGETWLEPTMFFPRLGSMAKTKPIKLKSGRIIVPFYNEVELCPYVTIADDINRCLGAPFVAETMARGKVMQPAVVELERDRLLMLCRSNRGTLWKSMSYNGGMSWSICKPTNLLNPYSAVDLIKIRTGELLLAFNNSSTDRYSLSIALSEDEGVTWSHLRDIVRETEGEFSYPSMIQDARGVIQLVYTENRYKINHVSFELKWIKEKPLDTPILTD
jgi:predicted neuraminidase